MNVSKRQLTGAGILCLLLLLLTSCRAGMEKREQEETSGSRDRTEAQDTAEDAVVVRPDKESYVADAHAELSNEKYAWWFKRNTAHEKSGCQEDFDIADYDGYYLDKDCTEKIIYITFDCGYENGYTPDILETLREAGVKAAFFVTQTFIRDNIELVKQMKEDGHLVCNHTVTHPSMPALSAEQIKDEILGCEAYMKEATGYDMDLFVRPPKGEYSERTLQICKDMGYKSIFWSIAYLDYDVHNQPGSGYVVEHFQKYHHPGAIVLMHNVSSANAAALPEVLAFLKAEGYRFGMLTNLN